MHCKYNLIQLDVDVNKYKFQANHYILPQLTSTEIYIHQNASIMKKMMKKVQISTDIEELLEPFKLTPITTKPCKCAWEFMTESDILKIREIKRLSELKKFIDKKLDKAKMKGLPRKLLIELFISVIKFATKLSLDALQTCSLLAIFYNTHLYFSHNLWITPEEIYKYFKDFIYFNCIHLLPLRKKIFELNACKPLAIFFCNNYLKNLPLIRMLMLPNYGLIFKTSIPKEFMDEPKGKDKKSDKKKKK